MCGVLLLPAFSFASPLLSCDIGMTNSLDSLIAPTKPGFLISGRVSVELKRDVYLGTESDLHYWAFQKNDGTFFPSDYKLLMLGQKLCFEFITRKSSSFFIKIIPSAGICFLSLQKSDEDSHFVPFCCVSPAVSLQYGNLSFSPSFRILFRGDHSILLFDICVGLSNMIK